MGEKEGDLVDQGLKGERVLPFWWLWKLRGHSGERRSGTRPGGVAENVNNGQKVKVMVPRRSQGEKENISCIVIRRLTCVTVLVTILKLLSRGFIHFGLRGMRWQRWWY